MIYKALYGQPRITEYRSKVFTCSCTGHRRYSVRGMVGHAAFLKAISIGSDEGGLLYGVCITPEENTSASRREPPHSKPLQKQVVFLFEISPFENRHDLL